MFTIMTRRLAATTLASMALILAGCSDDGVVQTGTAGDDQAVTEMLAMDLNLENGGTSAADERPSFGDAYFDKHLQDEESAADPLETDPRLRRLEDDPSATVFYVRLMWGNLNGAPEDAARDSSETRLNWRGCASVSDGLLIPRRVLKFERGDHLARPDSAQARQAVCWNSRTGPAWDGVLLQIVIPAASDQTLADSRRNTRGDGLTDDDTFTFSAPGIPVELTFKLSELPELDTVVMIDEVNGVAITGFTRDDLGDRCPQGPMVGHWVKAQGDSAQGGYFRAKWSNAIGQHVGHVRGRWGVSETGENIFVGKIVARSGKYLGHVRGTWEPGDQPGLGTLHGKWVVFGANDSVRAVGGMRGEYRVGDNPERGGLLRGKWFKDCPERNTDAE